jgi:hypothetical protein
MFLSAMSLPLALQKFSPKNSQKISQKIQNISRQFLKKFLRFLKYPIPYIALVGMKLYFPFHTLENVNIWKFITYKFELERGLPSANAESLALLPSKSWFCT